jgi:hypothetical protein
MLYYIILHHIIILWDHRRICGPSLTDTSLCGAFITMRCYANVKPISVARGRNSTPAQKSLPRPYHQTAKSACTNTSFHTHTHFTWLRWATVSNVTLSERSCTTRAQRPGYAMVHGTSQLSLISTAVIFTAQTNFGSHPTSCPMGNG